MFSVFSADYKIHFHNGFLKYHSHQNKNMPWQFCLGTQLNTQFPAYAWIQTHIAKNKNQKITPKNPIGYALFVPKSPSLSQNLKTPSKNPILHIHFSFSPADTAKESVSTLQTSMQNFIFLEKGAELTLIESFEISNGFNTPIYWTTYVQCLAQSSLNWLSVNQGAEKSSLSCETHGNIQSKASLNKLSLTLSEGHSKDFATVHHRQKSASSILLSLALLKQKARREQRWQTHLWDLRGYCRQHFKGILNDMAKSHFYGRVCLSPQSAQADVVQSAKSFLLSSKAQSLMNPEMEVHCGDVKAKHGATTGQLNKDEIFYLQSRGVPEAEAFEMLIMAHIKDILRFFPEQLMRDKLLQNIQENKKKYLNLLTNPLPVA